MLSNWLCGFGLGVALMLGLPVTWAWHNVYTCTSKVYSSLRFVCTFAASEPVIPCLLIC